MISKYCLNLTKRRGGYVVSCPALPGCYSQGDTIDEALENIKEAIMLCLKDLMAQQQPIPSMGTNHPCTTCDRSASGSVTAG
jgi:predicted RNase H-like HicB family nuclease